MHTLQPGYAAGPTRRVAGLLMLALLAAWRATPAPPPGMPAEPPPVGRHPAFGPPPRLRYAFAEAFAPDTPSPGPAAARERWAQLLRRADELLARPAEVPAESGDWYFYYACPEHNAPLVPRDGQHACPTCGKAYADERTRRAYATILHDRANDAVLALAQAWHVSRHEPYGREAWRILTRYAELYPGWERHDRWGRKGLLAVIGGRRYAQSLDEAFGIIRLAKAYDLLHDLPAVTPPERAAVEQRVFLDTVDSIYAFYPLYDGRNNHMTWFNAAAATVAATLARPDMLDRAVNGPRGLRWQFRESVTRDGLWYEGTLAYHFYALSAVVETVEAARVGGIDLTTEPALKAMFRAPLRLAYPNGQLPAINDGDRATLDGYRGAYAFAAATWPDPAFHAFAADGRLDELPSELFADAGLAYLRRGRGPAAVTAVLDFGPHGGHHGHPDKLNLMLYALGREIFLDPGRLTYRCPEYESWTRQSVAHNTVVIDGRSQEPATGQLLLSRTQAAHDAVAADAGAVYPGAQLRRALVLSDRLLVDLTWVRTPQPAAIDWLLHGRAALELHTPGGPAATTPGQAAGYQHLADLRTPQPSRRLDAAWRLPDGRALHTTLLCDAEATYWTGTGIGYELAQRAPFLLARRRATTAVFAAVHDLSGDGSAAGASDLTVDREGTIALCAGPPQARLTVTWNAGADGTSLSVSP